VCLEKAQGVERDGLSDQIAKEVSSPFNFLKLYMPSKSKEKPSPSLRGIGMTLGTRLRTGKEKVHRLPLLVRKKQHEIFRRAEKAKEAEGGEEYRVLLKRGKTHDSPSKKGAGGEKRGICYRQS